MLSRLCVVFILLGNLVALVPLAHASPPDPIWIAGLYDTADYDDVVLAVISLDSMGECTLLVIPGTSPIVVAFVPFPGRTRTTAAGRAFEIRAPPIR